MKENGIPVFGHRTAGGSCSILKFASPEGFLYSMSSAQQRLVDPDGKVAEGVDPDFVLSPIAEGGKTTLIIRAGAARRKRKIPSFRKGEGANPAS